jgi:hypothetical protein
VRAAANALMAGGMFRDAALLFRDRLRDESSAANAFEKAGDFDEAIRIFDKIGSFSNCGWILRRLGDDDRADDYFRRAAEVYAREGRWLRAAEFIQAHAGHLGLAREFYRRGWRADGGEGVTCGVRLFDDLLAGREFEPLAELVGEAAARFAPPRSQEAGQFFNHACAKPLPAPLRGDLADRARMLFAAHLRAPTGARAGDLATELFSRGSWPAPVARDAAFATRVVPRKPPAPPPDLYPSQRLVEGPVTAVAFAADAGDVIAAGGGEVVRWCVGTGRVVRVGPFHAHDVLAAACDPSGEALYSLHLDGGALSLRCWRFVRGEYERQSRHDFAAPAHGEWVLHPPASFRSEPAVRLSNLGRQLDFDGWQMRARPPIDLEPIDQRAHLLVSPRHLEQWAWVETTMHHFSPATVNRECRFVVPWQPRVPTGSSLFAPPLDWLSPLAGVLEVVGLDAAGNAYWSEFDGRDPKHPRSRTVATHADSFRAACLVAAGLVAAVTAANEVHWFRVTSGGALARWSNPRSLPFPARAVAAVARPQSNEVVVVLQDGLAVRVPRP